MADIREQIKKLQKDIKCLKCKINDVAANDIYVDGGSFDPGTLTLTLTDTNAGTPDVEINLSALVPDTLYSANGSIPAVTARTVTLGAGSSLVISGGFAGTLFSIDGDSGKVTMDGLLDPSGLQVTPQAVNPGSAQTYWSNSTDANNPYFGPDRLARYSELIADDQGLDEVLTINDNTGANNIIVATAQYIGWTNSGFIGRIIEGTFTANRTYTLPDNTGTIALVSDIPVPDGNGIYSGSGIIPTSVVSTLTDNFTLRAMATNDAALTLDATTGTNDSYVALSNSGTNEYTIGYDGGVDRFMICGSIFGSGALFNLNKNTSIGWVSTSMFGIGTTPSNERLLVRGSGTTSATTTLRLEASTGIDHFIVADNGQISIGVGQAASTITGSYGIRNDITGHTYGVGYRGTNQSVANSLFHAIGTTPWSIYALIDSSNTKTGETVSIYSRNWGNTGSIHIGLVGESRDGTVSSIGIEGRILNNHSITASTYIAAIRAIGGSDLDNETYGLYSSINFNDATTVYTKDFISVYGLATGTSGNAASTSDIIGGKFATSGTTGTGDRIALLVPSTDNNGLVVFGADNVSGTVMVQVTGELELFGDGDGFYMYQPDGTRRRITLDNAGAFVIT